MTAADKINCRFAHIFRRTFVSLLETADSSVDEIGGILNGKLKLIFINTDEYQSLREIKKFIRCKIYSLRFHRLFTIFLKPMIVNLSMKRT